VKWFFHNSADHQAECRLDGHHIEIPEKLGCLICKRYDTPCLLRRTIKYPNSSAGLRCACCKVDQCSFLKDDKYQKTPLQTWLDNQARDSVHDSAGSSISTRHTSTIPDGNSVPPTTSSVTRITLLTNVPMTPQSLASSPQVDANSDSDSDSDSTLSNAPSDDSDAQSPRAASTNGEGANSKRSRSDGGSFNDETPTTKAARFDTISSTDDIFAGGPSDSDFDQHVRGLVTHHQTVRKRNEGLDSAKKELEKELEHMQKLHEAWQAEIAGLEEWNGLILRQRGTALAAVMLATEKENAQEEELVKLRSENGKSKENVETLEARLEREVDQRKRTTDTAELLEKERDAGLKIIAGLKSDVKKIQDDTTERDAAVKNANTSRLERDVAQKALEAAVENGRQISDKLGEKTTTLDGAEIEIESLQKEVQQLRDECADNAAIKTQMIDLQASQVKTEKAKNRYKTELADAEVRIGNLKDKAQLADDRLIERQESNTKLELAKDELKEQAKEMKKVRIEMDKSKKAVVEIKRNYNIQKLELHRVHTELKGNNGVKREGNRERRPSVGRVKMEARVVIEISDDEDD
jgi:chromosome segregation ATPase